MRIAIPHWQGRVSPVFDVAGRLLVVDVENGKEQARRNVVVEADDPQARARLLGSLGANVLICGAISWPLEAAITAGGIEVVSQTCGDVERVLAAFIGGRLDEKTFLMPGCCGRRRRFRGGLGGGRCRAGWRKGGNGNAQR
ncbi:MAG: NifB/NifX family molybdenum-iron cluster-binding protein [Planctomycetes bacterium]|nr:NifB/NifX family molybdenum-iron cluster-binding protein [Planctomycetota bacterium]